MDHLLSREKIIVKDYSSYLYVGSWI